MRGNNHKAQAREAVVLARLYEQHDDHAAAAFHYMTAARLTPWWRWRWREECIRQALLCAVRGWPAREPQKPPRGGKIDLVRKKP